MVIKWPTLISASILLSFIIFKCSDAQQVSPCPRLFTYEARKDDEPDKWYGVLTLLSDIELTGVWLRLVFDRPSLQLGNWFGEVNRRGASEYLIKKPGFSLKPNVPQTIRFFIRYNVGEDIPMLTGFRLNAKTVCPEGLATPAPSTEPPALQTSDELGGSPKPPPPPPENPPNWRPGGGGGGGAGGGGGDGSSITFGRPEDPLDEDDYPTSDFHRPGGLVGGNRPNRRPGGPALPPPACGTVAVQPRPLITYGQSTYEGQYPWHAALYHAKNIDLTYICGASLISEMHVLTVAHCVTRRKTSGPLNPDSLVVYLGKYYLRRWSNVGIQDRQVEKIIPHPDYSSKTYVNDIALVKLKEAAVYTNYVRPICIWEEGADINTAIGRLGTVAGWGFDETGHVTEQLTQAQMPVVSQQTCLYSYPEFFSRFTNEKTYCAGFRNGTSVCNGDSGGGMVFPKTGSNPPVWQLRGLVSISVALQNQFKCDSGHYVVFTDVAKYLGWVKGSMKV